MLSKTEPPDAVAEFDKLASRLSDLERDRDELFPICLLGQAGVGKSTLINTLVSDADIVVPSGGGIGPLTANALRVSYGDKATFAVRYHSKKGISQTCFILEAAIAREAKEAVERSYLEPDDDENDLQWDSEEEKSSRTEDALARARLLVSGAQSARRDPKCLVDALRSILGRDARFGTQVLEEDVTPGRHVMKTVPKTRLKE